MGKGALEMVRKIEWKTEDVAVENYSGRVGGGVGKAMEGIGDLELCGQRWGILFYPEGVDHAAHTQGYASVYLQLTATATDTKHVQFLANVIFLDQSTNQEYFAYSTFSSLQVARLRASEAIGSPNCIERAKLHHFVNRDCLKIRVCVGVFTTSHRRRHRLQFINMTMNMLHHLQRFHWWFDEFIFFRVADNMTFCAAKSVLAARCPALLPQNINTNINDDDDDDDDDDDVDVVIPDLDHLVFMDVLWFIHRDIDTVPWGRIRDSDPQDLESHAAKLLGAAHKFEIPALKKICEESMSHKVCTQTVASLLYVAHLCNATLLKSACLNFAAQNQAVILESDACERLKQTYPLLFLELIGLGDRSHFPK